MKELLDQIIAEPQIHARWLNTLSFLEHVGTRKIHKTQSRPDMTDMILRHASEEARHAHFFKRMAEKVDAEHSGDYRYESMLIGYSAYRYFQGLDSMVEKQFLDRKISERSSMDSSGKKQKADSFLCYLYVTTLIEERAGWLYPIYEERLRHAGSDISLASVIQEEERHLTDMHDALRKVDPQWEEQMNDFREREAKMFESYRDKLKKSLVGAVV